MDETERLELLAGSTRYGPFPSPNSGDALLRLAIRHLLAPAADPESAAWTARELQERLDTYLRGEADSLEGALRINRGDRRTAQLERTRDVETGLLLIVRLVLECEVQRKATRKKGDTRFHQVARILNRIRPLQRRWSPGGVKAAYYAYRDTELVKTALTLAASNAVHSKIVGSFRKV